jgi:hypothetical protein
LILYLLVVTALLPGVASAVCAVEGKLEAVRLDLVEPLAFVLHVRHPNGVVPNAFHVERTQNAPLGDLTPLFQLMSVANPANATILAVGDLASCPDATEVERARASNKAVPSGRLLWVLVKYR